MTKLIISHNFEELRKLPKTCKSLTDIAAKLGCLGVLKWAINYGFVWDDDICIYATKFKHYHILEWLYQTKIFSTRGWNCYLATGGDLELMKWFKAKDFPLTKDTFVYSVDKRDIQILEWLKEVKCPYSKEAACAAAQLGFLDVLKWLLMNNYAINYRAILGAAQHGNLEILKWLDAEGIKYKDDLNPVMLASENNHFETVKWLIQNGYDYGEFVILDAILAQNLNFIKWTYDNNVNVGIYISEDCYDRAKDVGNYEILLYLHNKGAPGNWKCKEFERKCKYCIANSKEKSWELWYDIMSYLRWPPEEVIEDILLLI